MAGNNRVVNNEASSEEKESTLTNERKRDESLGSNEPRGRDPFATLLFFQVFEDTAEIAGEFIPG